MTTPATHSPESATPAERRVLVWDLPTRVFHWLLAGSFAGAFLTAESERYRDVHAMLGYTVVGLVLFRLVWGLVGTRHSRFSSFAFGPRRVAEYLRSLARMRPQHFTGHNPAGSWVIFALLGLALVVGASGLATYNDVGGHWLEELHEGAANAMLALVGLHVAGVAVGSLLHRENLVRAMVTGRKFGAAGDAIRGPRRLAAVVLLALVAGLWTGYLPAPGLEASAGATGPAGGASVRVSDRGHRADEDD